MSKNSLYHLFEPSGEFCCKLYFCSDADWILEDFIPITAKAKKLYSKGQTKLNYAENCEALYQAKDSFSKIKDGDILLVKNGLMFDYFIEELIDFIDAKIIVVVSSDPTIPNQIRSRKKLCQLLEAGKIIHIFGRNLNTNYLPKNATQIPIGLRITSHPFDKDVIKHRPKKCEKFLKQLIQTLPPTNQRTTRLLCDAMKSHEYSPSPNIKSRNEILQTLKNNGVCDTLTKRVPWPDFMRIKGKRAFDVSPPGVGVDCYRTWESLLMGCIVLVQSSFLDPLFEGLPVIPITDWNTVTEENLQKWLNEYGDVLHNPSIREKLTHKYWMDKIYKVQEDYRNSQVI